MPPLDILYEEGPALVLNKPPGLSTQAPPGIDSLEVRVKQLLAERRDATGKVYLGVPHRLDRPASGAIVFALHTRAARRISRQFEDRQVQKVYWAAVSGQVTPDEGIWEDHLIKIPDQPRAAVVPPDHPGARPALLGYRVLRRGPWGSLLEIELQTGRTHQIRIQAASRGWPVLGDEFYGSSEPFGPWSEDPRGRAIALHARLLGFRHPMSRAWLEITAPPPACWGALEIPPEPATCCE